MPASLKAALTVFVSGGSGLQKEAVEKAVSTADVTCASERHVEAEGDVIAFCAVLGVYFLVGMHGNDRFARPEEADHRAEREHPTAIGTRRGGTGIASELLVG